LVEVEREGGRVRFPSGRVHWYGISGARMPHVGGHYILFLTSNNQEQAFNILTGYELRSSKVIPLDALPNSKLYKNVDETQFMNELRSSIAYSHRSLSE
jgi:hypothetical protein